MRTAEAVNRLIVIADVRGSGTLRLTAKQAARDGVYQAFEEGFEEIGATGDVHQEDRGDGIFAAVGPGVPPVRVVGPWLEAVHQSVRHRNEAAAHRLRLRIGMAMGPVSLDGRGAAGRAADLAGRLCDCDTARRVLDLTPQADLVVAVSDWLYTQVVVDGGRFVEPEAYRSALVRSKETEERAWFHVPRFRRPRFPGDGTAEDGPGAGGDGDGRPGRGAGDTGPGDGDAGPPGSGEPVVRAAGDLAYYRDSVFRGPVTAFDKRGGAGGAR